MRDEAEHVADCLQSLSGIVDEAVVVDTGSVDGTAEIARRSGAIVLHRAWNDNFSEARNASLDAANGEWILYIDADERLVTSGRGEIERLLVGAPELAFRILLQPAAGTTPYREYRLWRNDPRIRFDGIIHEKVVPSIHHVAEAEHRPIGLADLMLVHLGYEGDQTRKHWRNLPLLRAQLEVEPGNLFAWNHLGRVLEGLGQADEAEGAFERALQIAREGVRGGRSMDPVAALSYADLVWVRARRGTQAGDLLAEGVRFFPDNAVLLWIEARRSIDGGRYEEAIGWLDRILAIDRERTRDEGPAYERRLLDEMPLAAKALCEFRLGRFDEAASAYAAAAVAAPDDDSHRIRAELARARARAARADAVDRSVECASRAPAPRGSGPSSGPVSRADEGLVHVEPYRGSTIPEPRGPGARVPQSWCRQEGRGG